MRKMVLTQTVAVPPEDVFVFFVPQRMAYWYGPEMRMSIEAQGCGSDFRVGSQVRISGTIANRNVSHTAVVSAFDRGRVFEWQFEDAYGIRGKERWELERLENEDGPRTLIRFTNEYETPGRLGRALDWLLTRHTLKRRNRDYLNRLAHLAERRPLTQSAAKS